LFENPCDCEKKDQFLSDRGKQLLFESICINSRGILMLDSEANKQDYSGSRNELSLLKFAYHFDYDYQKYRPSERIRKVFPYSSGIRRMITLYQHDELVIRIFCKGFPDLVLKHCTHYLYHSDLKPFH
jgi:magnesium-transporting ATPase (P-type)